MRTKVQPGPGEELSLLGGEVFGSYSHSIETEDGELLVVDRTEHYGGGQILVPADEMRERDGVLVAPYEELSIMEAPPYSPNAEPEAYLRFWDRLDGRNLNSTPDEYTDAGSGPVQSEQTVPDEHIEALVRERLEDHEGEVPVMPHLVQVSVKDGTVTLEGFQPDTASRLEVARVAAAVPGVTEVVNMLVIRAS